MSGQSGDCLFASFIRFTSDHDGSQWITIELILGVPLSWLRCYNRLKPGLYLSAMNRQEISRYIITVAPKDDISEPTRDLQPLQMGP